MNCVLKMQNNTPATIAVARHVFLGEKITRKPRLQTRPAATDSDIPQKPF
jgi:hypothetical protein